MAKSKKTKHEPLPIRSSAQIKEDDSRIVFESLIHPWMICSWIQRDFGIDASVEITKPISNSKDQIVTGKRFSVQLKSSDSAKFNKASFSLSISKEKITYWFESIEPVLLVYIDLKTESCFYRWIDEALIQELFSLNSNWIAQASVSIRFNKTRKISSSALLEIEKYVLHWKIPSKSILTPGNYFKYSQEAKSFIDTFCNSTEQYEINLLQNEIHELKESTARTIYTIAIVGPSRAGKSTLINCLLQQEVSPVGMLPTTGIPITILPQNENKSIVVFKNNTEVIGGVESSFLERYTSQKKNPDNEQGVKHVSVHIINTLLEKGFALCDVPGLDDPDDEIRTITKTALYNVNAIIYVINAASMRDGGFSITKQIIDDLNELGGRMDRLFLVFNKTDVLNNEQINQLKEYVNTTLKKYQVLNHLPTAPLYISSKDSFDGRMRKIEKQDTVSELEEQIWEYLLSHNKTGLHRIIGIYADGIELMDKLKKLLSARMTDNETRLGKEKEIQKVKSEMNNLRTFVAENRQSIYASHQEYIVDSFKNILSYLKKDLNGIPLDQNLPEKVNISAWLENNAFAIISKIYSDLEQDVYELQSGVNQWISENLKVEIGIDDSNNPVKFQMPEITRYTNQIQHYFSDRKIWHIGILESFFQRIEAVLEKFFSAMDNLITSKSVNRQRQIRNIISKSEKSYQNIAKECLVNLNKYLNEVCRSIEEKSLDRSNVYLSELSKQMWKFDQPISDIEKQNFENFLSEMSDIENKMGSNLSHLKAYTDGVEWLT